MTTSATTAHAHAQQANSWTQRDTDAADASYSRRYASFMTYSDDPKRILWRFTFVFPRRERTAEAVTGPPDEQRSSEAWQWELDLLFQHLGNTRRKVAAQ